MASNEIGMLIGASIWIRTPAMDAREAPEVKLPNVTLEMSELGVPREDVLQELFAVMDLEASAVLIPRDDVLESFRRGILQHAEKDHGE